MRFDPSGFQRLQNPDPVDYARGAANPDNKAFRLHANFRTSKDLTCPVASYMLPVSSQNFPQQFRYKSGADLPLRRPAKRAAIKPQIVVIAVRAEFESSVRNKCVRLACEFYQIQFTPCGDRRLRSDQPYLASKRYRWHPYQKDWRQMCSFSIRDDTLRTPFCHGCLIKPIGVAALRREASSRAKVRNDSARREACGNWPLSRQRRRRRLPGQSRHW